MHEPRPDEIIRLFTEWEAAAAQSPNPKVAIGAPLEPPTTEEAAALLARLRGIQDELAGTTLMITAVQSPIGTRPPWVSSGKNGATTGWTSGTVIEKSGGRIPFSKSRPSSPPRLA